MTLAGWAACCFAVGLAGTWLARRYALRAALLDQPGERRSHAVATPRGGGIAIAAAMVPVLLALACGPAGAPGVYLPILGGLGLVAGIGWYDDHRPQSPLSRLAVHAVAAALVAWALHVAGSGPVVAGIGFVLTLVLVNVWNFMDGIDGLAASQAMVAGLGYAVFAGGGPVALGGVALAAACAGFLPFNLPRARIFLGDVGSGALGYLLAVLAMLAARSLPAGGQAPALLLVLPLMAFGLDAALTLARRILRGERWWEPHVQHAYQAQARRRGHAAVTLRFFLFTFVASVFMVTAKQSSPMVIMCTTAAMVALACGAWWRTQSAERDARQPGSGSAA